MSRQANEVRPAEVTADFLGCVGVFEAEFDYVYHSLRRHGIGPHDAEDLVQEVFLVMWRRWAEYDTTRPLRPWLGGIAFRVAYNHRQRIGREVPGGLVDAEDEAPSPEDRLDSVSARSLVLRVLAALPEKYRALIVSHDLDGVPMREIADTLRVPLFTAHTRLRAARLAFAKGVRRLQAVTAARAEMSSARLRAAALMQVEREAPPPAQAGRRRRAISRARGLAAAPGFPSTPAPPMPTPRSAPWAQGLAAATAVVAVAGLIAFVAADRRTPRPAPARVRQPVAARTLLPAPPPSAAASLTRGLAGYWRFDDGAGSATAQDWSGNGNHCQLRGLRPESDWTEGQLGGAITFDGDGWLECPHTQALARIDKAASVALWIKRTGRRGHVRALVSRQYERGILDRFHFGFRNDELVLRSRTPGLSSKAPFPAARGHWIHVAFTRSADGLARLFIDGEPVVAKQSDRLSLGGGDNPLIIGGGVNGPDQGLIKENLQGVVDELLIYDRDLSPTEVAALAAGTQPDLQ